MDRDTPMVRFDVRGITCVLCGARLRPDGPTVLARWQRHWDRSHSVSAYEREVLKRRRPGADAGRSRAG